MRARSLLCCLPLLWAVAACTHPPASTPDASSGPSDAGTVEAPDASAPEASGSDAGLPDAATLDAGASADAGDTVDAGGSEGDVDAGGADAGAPVPRVCGDSVVAPNEACDDGNTTGGDYCSADCTAITGWCSDGFVQRGEACDDGNAQDGDHCSADCSTVTGRCGDAIRQSNEACDDGNTLDGDHCSAGCTVASSCGDGVVQPRLEVCDPGPALPPVTRGGAGSTCTHDRECDATAPICQDGRCGTTRCPATRSPETCDGLDNDCDGTVDNGCPTHCPREDIPVVDIPDGCTSDCATPIPGTLVVPCGAVVTLSGEHRHASGASVRGVVRVAPLDAALGGGALHIRAQTVNVSGVIQATGAGWWPGTGPGSPRTQCDGAGAGYGGVGRGSARCPGGGVYGMFGGRTVELGSGGADNIADLHGAPGGGAVTLDGVTVDVSGLVAADGAPGEVYSVTGQLCGGSGSGGGILLLASERIDVSGTLSVRGGGSPCGRGGGGGRVKLHAPAGSITGTIQVQGGEGAGPGTFLQAF